MSDETIISSVKDLLSGFAPLGLDVQAKELEPLREPLLSLRCKLQKEYYQAREKLRVPKDKEYTDLDRNTMLDAYSSEVREKYELVKGLEELVGERVELIKILLGAK